MNDQKIIKSKSRLPDELLLKGLQACVEPYSLKVHQHVYNTVTMKALFDNLSGGDELIQALQKLEMTSKPCLNSTTLIVRAFTTANNREYISGLPKVTNLKLVNKMFYNEVNSIVSANFDSKLRIESITEFRFKEASVVWKPHSKPLTTLSLIWAYPLIKEIFFSGIEEARYTLPYLQKGLTPNLRTITMYGGNTVSRATGKQILKGGYDGIVQFELENNLNDFAKSICELSASQHNRVQLIVYFDAIVAPRMFLDDLADGVVESTWYRFIVEMTSPTAWVIKKRERRIKD